MDEPKHFQEKLFPSQPHVGVDAVMDEVERKWSRLGLNWALRFLIEIDPVGWDHELRFPGHCREDFVELFLVLGDWFVVLRCHSFQVGRNIQKFPLQKYPSLGEQTSLTHPTQGKFSQQSPDDVFVPARKKSKESLKKAEFGIPERKTKVFPPWPSSASELESRNVLQSFAAAWEVVLSSTSHLVCPFLVKVTPWHQRISCLDSQENLDLGEGFFRLGIACKWF